jgi:GNAT superfamily N-acetyltransferase
MQFLQQEKITYRIAESKDIAQLAKLRWDFRNESGDESPAVSFEDFSRFYANFFKQGLESGNRVHWLAEMDGEIIATIVVQKIDMVPRPCKLKDQFGYITDNYTKPAYRHRGIGSVVINKVKEWATEQDLELLIAWPSEGAMTFYKRAGFYAENDILELRLRNYYSPEWIENTDK